MLQAPPNDPSCPATTWQKWIMKIYDDKAFYVEGGYTPAAAAAANAGAAVRGRPRALAH